MAASVQCRPQDRTLGMVMKEVEGDLAIFLEMRKHEERNGLVLLGSSDRFDDSTASNLDSLVLSDAIFTETAHKTPAADNFLDAESEKSDYDWLLTPPGTPTLPLMEMEVQNVSSQTAIANAPSVVELSKLANPPDEPSSVNNKSAQPITSTSKHSSASRNRKASSSGGPKSTASRSATPTRRPALPAASKPSRSSTPTSRGIAPSNKPLAPPVRSSTPTRATARSSTPPARSLIQSTSMSASRSATPTRKSSTPSSATNISAPSGRSSSVSKAVPTTLKNPGTSRGTFPAVKSWPKKTAEKPVFSPDVPPNLKMAFPKRPSSASRGRPVSSSSLSSASDATTRKPRQKSCSPSRERINHGSFNSGTTVLSKSRGYSNGSDDVNPVLIGTKMVERVVNMRKLAPPKQENHESQDNSTRKSSLSQENSGFGRSLSKKSLDMAIRHMDIRSISGNLKTIATSLPASNVLSVRSGSTKTRTTSLSDSPLATCSNSSSELSVNNGAHVLDGSDVEVNDIACERESPSLTSSQN
ncbi:hypothetical protein ACH5RR_004970 [Cinchona calisaya]|uniref:Uncharacterized protein n=1 Tax=Cinchona calisaya TaxID=153742 RepID=A0ABD3AZX9_9GENT